nr:unnamed protein product [Callosobruchus chinensis]
MSHMGGLAVGVQLQPKSVYFAQRHHRDTPHFEVEEHPKTQFRKNVYSSVYENMDDMNILWFHVNIIARILTTSVSSPGPKSSQRNRFPSSEDACRRSKGYLHKVLAPAPVVSNRSSVLLSCQKLIMPLVLSVDASPIGLGAFIPQNGHPIKFASVSLTSTQQRYNHVCYERFHYYVFGRYIRIETDLRPLLALLKKPLDDLSPRLQRLAIRLLRPPRVQATTIDYTNLFNQIPYNCIIGGDFNAHHSFWGSPTCSSDGNVFSGSDRGFSQPRGYE